MPSAFSGPLGDEKGNGLEYRSKLENIDIGRFLTCKLSSFMFCCMFSIEHCRDDDSPIQDASLMPCFFSTLVSMHSLGASFLVFIIGRLDNSPCRCRYFFLVFTYMLILLFEDEKKLPNTLTSIKSVCKEICT